MATANVTAEEFEKTVSAAWMRKDQAVLLDNLNSLFLKSPLLASASTERPCLVRILGYSRLVPLSATGFIVITGNAIAPAEDIVRRLLQVELDAKVEDPEQRPFEGDILAEIAADRLNLLAAALTVWRWGRQQSDLPLGKPLGSFGQWSPLGARSVTCSQTARTRSSASPPPSRGTRRA